MSTQPTHWIDIQEKAFTRWCNEHLKKRGYHIDNLKTDLQDGILLCNLLEIISGGKSVGRWNKNPRVPAQKYENTQLAMQFVASEGIKTVNISNDDITNGRLKLILGLIWTLILRYQIKSGGDGNDTAKNELLKWVQSKIPEYNIQGFTKDWNDGRAICALNNALEPGLCPNHRNLDPKDGLNNATRGIDLGYNELGVPKVVLANEMVNPRVDELAMMTYISYYRDLDAKREKRDDASRCVAYGPGLVEAVVNEAANFTVETPGRGKLEIKVIGPKSNAVATVKNNNGIYSVSYNPTEPGEYQVHVTLDGKHVPGSIFKVRVLQQTSLGGEGKIRVFYTTTTHTNEKTRPMQELLEKKGVHLRPDFEPWIPVDIMEPKDRDAVFKKAGTKTLPIIFIDDVYIGDYPRLLELEGSGELNRMLNYNQKK
eukprot:TRINITY_DN4985_c0_g1_i1.p1 TRINITY_DN4985_c0_g1~~TRINITY_DN4985_c0_g1_i1.p1  ORF type:complete len:439 (+),score=122.80 TRINITY_DN4985_c0_g1_i1:38-1318(+)